MKPAILVLAGAWGFLCVASDALAFAPLATTRAVALVLVLALALDGSGRRFRVPHVAGVTLLLGGLALLSVVWSAAPASSVRVGRHIVLEGLLLALLATARDRRGLFRALAAGAALGGLVLMGAFALELFAGAAHGRRLHLWGGDGNHQARGVALGALAWLVLRPRSAPLVAGLLFLGVGMTGSRGATVAAFAALVVLFWRGGALRRPVAALALAGLMLGALLPALRADLRPPLEGISAGDLEALTSGRDAVWANSLAIAADHAPWGVGAGAIPAVYDAYRTERMARGGAHSKYGRDAHNQFLEALAGLGFLGLGLLLAVLLLPLRGPPEAAVLIAFASASAATVTTWEQKGWWLAVTLAVLAAPRRSGPEATAPVRGGGGSAR